MKPCHTIVLPAISLTGVSMSLAAAMSRQLKATVWLLVSVAHPSSTMRSEPLCVRTGINTSSSASSSVTKGSSAPFSVSG